MIKEIGLLRFLTEGNLFGQIGLIHYISAAYIVLSLILMLTRKYRLRILTMLPPICQVASILVLHAMGFPLLMTAPLFLVNLLIVVLVNLAESKQMGQVVPEGRAERERPKRDDAQRKQSPAKAATSARAERPKEYGGFAVDFDLLTASPAAEIKTAAENVQPENMPDLTDVKSSVLKMPDVENKPINKVAPVQQKIFEASHGEVEAMIEAMIASGDMANAKRYLRMLAFFAKDDESRKIAEKKLAEINGSAN